MYFVARSLFGLWAFMPVAVTMTETMTNSLITNDTFLPSRKSVEQLDDIIFEFESLLYHTFTENINEGDPDFIHFTMLWILKLSSLFLNF